MPAVCGAVFCHVSVPDDTMAVELINDECALQQAGEKHVLAQATDALAHLEVGKGRKGGGRGIRAHEWLKARGCESESG